ncbi:MAG: DUF4410 domain-containing protein [Desulfatibacillum sp.]|nr:DUF4410 domain-containing protein [Desulfatibacillum sp.]
MKKLIFLCILSTLILYGCGAGRTFVVEPCKTQYTASSVMFEENDSTVVVPTEMKITFQKALGDMLYEQRSLEKGSELKIAYSFIQFEPGSRFKRYMWGGVGNSGEGSLTIRAAFLDVAGNELSTIQTEGVIGSGLFGGSFDNAIEKAAEEIAEYVEKNYLVSTH